MEPLEARQLMAADLASSVCSAGVCTESESFSGTPDLTDSAIFDQFDSSLGTLLSVKVGMELTSDGGSFQADNDSENPANFDVSFGAEGSISSTQVGLFSSLVPIPAPVFTTISTSQGATFDLAGTDGDDTQQFDVGGADWDRFDGTASTSMDSGNIDAGLFAGYEGTSTFGIDYDIKQVGSTTSAGGVFRQIDPVTASGIITVTYEYEPVTPVYNPSVELDKFLWDINGDPNLHSNIRAGDELIYAFEVTNTGDSELTNVSVSDSLPGFVMNENVQLGDVEELVAFDGTLDPGEVVTFMGHYIVTMDDVLAGEVINTATVDSHGPDGGPITDQDVENTPIDPLVSEIDIDKHLWDINGDPDITLQINEGDELIYGFTITNTGETELTGVTVTDSLPGFVMDDQVEIGDTHGLVDYDGTLSPGDYVTFMGTYIVTLDDVLAGEVVNTGTVTSNDVYGDPVGDVDVETTPVYTPVSSIDIDKHLWDINGDPNLHSDIHAGDELIYGFTITNTGETELTGVSVTDSLPGFVMDDQVEIGDTHGLVDYDGTLSPGDYVTFMGTYIVTMDDVIAGEVVNTGTVSANGLGDIPINDTDVENTPIDPLVVSIDIDKHLWDINGDPDLTLQINEGDELIYGFTITNTGESPLTGVTATDSLPGFVMDEHVQIGDVHELVDYDGTLDPGDYVTFMGTYTVTIGDVLAGEVVNTGTVSAHDIYGDPVVNDDVETVPVYTPVSSIDIDKHLWDINGDPNLHSDIHAGDELIYGFTVTNTGETELTGVSVTDSLPGFVMDEQVEIGDTHGLVDYDGTLSPGDYVTFMGTYVVTMDDVIAGEVVNTGTVNANGLGDVPIDGSDVETTPIDLLVSTIDIDKHLWDINGDPNLHDQIKIGDELIYGFTITNTGESPLTGVSVTDSLPGFVMDEHVQIGDVLEMVDFDGMLDPGEVVTFMGTYIVSLDDVTAGEVVNTGTVSSHDVYGNAVGDTDVETTPIAATEFVVLDKYLWDINGSPDLHNDIQVGDELIYSLEVTNVSSETVTNVIVTDVTPGVVMDEEVAVPYVAFEQQYVVPGAGELGPYSLVDRTLTSDPEEAKAWDNFSLTQDVTVIDAISWVGAYDEPFAVNGATPETDFVIEIAAANGSGLPGNLLHSFYIRGGEAGVDDVNVGTTLLAHASPQGGSAYEYHAMLPFTSLASGDYFVSITAQQTYPSASPIIDPSWQWHLGADADGGDGFYYYDDLFDDAEDVDGTPNPANFEAGKDLAFTWHAAELVDFDGTLEAGESVMYMSRYYVTQDDVDRGYFTNVGNVVATLPNGVTTEDTDSFTWTINPAPVPPACIPSIGDIDGDGTVSFGDFLTLSTNFGSTNADASMGDLDCDGQVAFNDFLILSSNFGQTVEAAAESVDALDALDAAFAEDDSAWLV